MHYVSFANIIVKMCLSYSQVLKSHFLSGYEKIRSLERLRIFVLNQMYFNVF